jgi:hypothetical protein
MTMTPEDIEQLKQLKQLVDSGVLSPEDFEIQKNLIFSSAENSVVGTRRRLDELLPGSDVPRPLKTTNDIVQAAQRAAVRVQILAFVFAAAGIIFGLILMTYKDEWADNERPYVGTGAGVAINAVVLAIVLYAIGKYMEARLKQGSDASS